MHGENHSPQLLLCNAPAKLQDVGCVGGIKPRGWLQRHFNLLRRHVHMSPESGRGGCEDPQQHRRSMWNPAVL